MSKSRNRKKVHWWPCFVVSFCWQHITLDSYIPCLTDLCKALWEVMLSYHRTMQWHEEHDKLETAPSPGETTHLFNPLTYNLLFFFQILCTRPEPPYLFWPDERLPHFLQKQLIFAQLQFQIQSQPLGQHYLNTSGYLQAKSWCFNLNILFLWVKNPSGLFHWFICFLSSLWILFGITINHK